MASSVARAAAVRKEPVDGVAHRRRRELQVVRAETEACRRTTERLCRRMADDRAKLDAAVAEYGRRSAALARRQSEAHDRLVALLHGRSAAERRREAVHDRAENELRARRTASTVRAYRLDARWRQLNGRYRGFAMDVLDDAGGGRPPSSSSLPPPPPTPPAGTARRRPGPAAKLQGRRFFALADQVGTQYRRESLRTSRSLHRLMSGYLRETTSSSRSELSLDVLDGAEPVQVLDKLRVMQEQCARIAERVRRRTTTTTTTAAGGRGRRSPETGDGGGGKRPQAEVLSEAQRTVAAGRQYLDRIRRLTDAAVGEVEREQTALRRLLCATCAVCVGKRAPLRYGSSPVPEIAGRLERACFELFARLDGAGGRRRTSDRPAETTPAPARGTAGVHDVVASCLRAVHEHRVNAVRRVRDTERRVDDFRKAVARLLLAAAPRTDLAAARPPSHYGGKRVTSAATETGGRRRPRETTVASSTTSRSLRPKYYNYSEGATTESAVDVPIASVTMLCPPSIGIIQYE
ncbi:Uncharacterized protein FWK35_00007143 [Aphis craccivora]|uniref:Uncharacterized protein n=1 Tax=Aphis craccivora TaxID=307492 RepID=A0A6G0ZEA2_APHCR|nr:Uncharacterized protein FWK35_00007143 [Aphis craccivora]